jgi:hypothetical protein
LVVLGPWRELDGDVQRDPTVAPAVTGTAPAVERRSLLAEATRSNALPESSPSSSDSTSGSSGSEAPAAPASEPNERAGNRTATAGSARGDAKATASSAINPARAMRATPLAPKRRRATRPEFAEGATADSELDGIFAAPGAPERRAPADTVARELDGLFPAEEQATLGANGAPLPD